MMDRNEAGGGLLAMTCGGGVLFNALLKVVASRPPPELAPNWLSADFGSYPSGHAMNSLLVYFTVWALLARPHGKAGEVRYALVLALIPPFLVGLSRVYLGVHYPTDVLAGWGIAAAWISLCFLATRRLVRG